MGVTITEGNTSEHEGSLESEDDLDEVRLTAPVMDRTFQRGLWDQINAECGTNIDEYEGVWLEDSNLIKAANLIRQNLNEDSDAPSAYVECLTEAALMLESCACRHVRVMFSL